MFINLITLINNNTTLQIHVPQSQFSTSVQGCHEMVCNLLRQSKATVVLMQYIVRTCVNALRNAILPPRYITYRSKEHKTRNAGS